MTEDEEAVEGSGRDSVRRGIPYEGLDTTRRSKDFDCSFLFTIQFLRREFLPDFLRAIPPGVILHSLLRSSLLGAVAKAYFRSFVEFRTYHIRDRETNIRDI